MKCLVTNLEAVVTNNNLPIFGTIKIHHSNVQGKTGILRVNNSAIGKTITVKVDGGNTFSVNGVNYSEYQIAASKHPQITFSQGDYNIFIENKYDVESIFSEGDADVFANAGITPENLGYMPSLKSIQFSKFGDSGFNGDIKNLNTPLIEILNINFTGAYGDIKNIGKFANIKTISLYPSGLNGELLEFAAEQNKAGRSSVTYSSPIAWNNISQNSKLNGVIMYGDRGFLTFSVVNNVVSKVTVYLGAATIADCTRVYCYGATSEEIAAWEAAKKTVVKC